MRSGGRHGADSTRWEQNRVKQQLKRQRVEKGDDKQGPQSIKFRNWNRIIGQGALNAQSALTTEDPDLLLCACPEAKVPPGQRNGSVQAPALLSNVVQNPGQKDVLFQPRSCIARISAVLLRSYACGQTYFRASSRVYLARAILFQVVYPKRPGMGSMDSCPPLGS